MFLEDTHLRPDPVWEIPSQLLRKSLKGRVKRQKAGVINVWFEDSDRFAKESFLWIWDSQSGSGSSLLPSRLARRREVNWRDAFDMVAIERGLIVLVDGRRDPLPNLRRVWDNIGALDIASAQPALARRDNEIRSNQRATLSLAGITLQANVAVIVGPVILLALLLYLLVHVVHIQAIAAGHELVLATFPWVPLFDTALSTAVSWMSLWFLPCAASVWLVTVAPVAARNRALLSIAYVSAVTAIALPLLRKVHRLAAVQVPRPQPTIADSGAEQPSQVENGCR